MTRIRVVVVIAAIAVLTCAGGATWAWSGLGSHRGGLLLLVNPAGGSFGLAVATVPTGTTVSAQTDQLCVIGRPVMITRVRAIGASPQRVQVDWAVKPEPVGGPGEARGVPAKLGAAFVQAPITADCWREDSVTLAVSIRSSSSVTSVKAFAVDYPDGTITIPFSLTICARKICSPTPD